MTTHWSLVLAAGGQLSGDAECALAALCENYWYPLYVFVRRQNYNHDEAQDLTQHFFARLLEKDFLGQVDQERGRFRSFLLACLKHFLSNERDRERAQKRGGGRQLISMDGEEADQRYRLEPVSDLTPEKIFERRWAMTLLERTLNQLRDECVAAGTGDRFDQLKPFITGGAKDQSYRQAAAALDMTEDAAKALAYRLRKRYRQHLRDEILQTVSTPQQVDEEIRDLFSALGE